MPSSRQIRGHDAEHAAENFLLKKGLTIVDRHVTSRYGEIDILARDGETLVAVEVKFRSNEAMGRAIESMTSQKIERVHSALEDYCDIHEISGTPIRIDLVTIDGETIEYFPGVSLS